MSSDFDYSLPWFRAIVAESERQMKVADVKRLLAASQKLVDALKKSPMWPLLQSEPIVNDFMVATENLETNINQWDRVVVENAQGELLGDAVIVPRIDPGESVNIPFPMPEQDDDIK